MDGSLMAANRTLVTLAMDQSWPGQSGLYKRDLVRFTQYFCKDY